MKSYPTKFSWKIVQIGALQKLQNSIQTLITLWSVYPIHRNSLFWVIFEELPFCHFPPPNTFIRGKWPIQSVRMIKKLMWTQEKKNEWGLREKNAPDPIQ